MKYTTYILSLLCGPCLLFTLTLDLTMHTYRIFYSAQCRPKAESDSRHLVDTVTATSPAHQVKWLSRQLNMQYCWTSTQDIPLALCLHDAKHGLGYSKTWTFLINNALGHLTDLHSTYIINASLSVLSCIVM